MALPGASTQALDTCRDLRGRDFLSIRDLQREELRALLDVAADVKASPGAYAHALRGQTLAMVFEKPSLRTRVSFDVAAYQLGGHAVYLSPQEIGLGTREPIGDVAHTLEGMVQAVMVRTFAHETVERLAEAAAIPVINGLSDRTHPCQALADFLTMREVFGGLDGLTLAYVGDSNNVTDALIAAATLLGVRMRVASPPGYGPGDDVLAWAARHGANPDAACQVTSVPEQAVREADVVYTDTWISMGQEADASDRRRAFAGYEVTPRLFEHARADAVFMHCLPAHRGEEVAPEVIDSRRSVVFRQAANRLPTEKALLVALLSPEV
jgi:ornithine carbamoyltransferase